MKTTDLAPLHVVLGAGQIGPLVATELLSRGLRVRLVRRGAFNGAPAGAQLLSADLADPAAAVLAVAGASVVYHCVTPPYTDWARQLLPLQRQIVAAATRAGAHLVVLDNLYAYGRASGPMTEQTPERPCSRKGELRAAAAAELVAARKRGDLAVTIGRAADFFGPGATLAAIFGDRFWARILAGKPGESFGDPDAPHSYSYVPDVASALVRLGTDARARNELWHLPVQPAEPTRSVIARFGAALGRELPTARVPKLALRAMGLFMPVVREIVEMTYQWEQPFVLDDARFRATFGAAAAPWDEAIGASVAWARPHYARRADASSRENVAGRFSPAP